MAWFIIEIEKKIQYFHFVCWNFSAAVKTYWKYYVDSAACRVRYNIVIINFEDSFFIVIFVYSTFMALLDKMLFDISDPTPSGQDLVAAEVVCSMRHFGMGAFHRVLAAVALK